MKILDQFYSLVKPGWRVLDLGAGEGKQAKQMTSLGANVVAVDGKKPQDSNPTVTWNIMPIQEWVATLSEDDVFDAILARNSLQFFKKDFAEKELLPILSKHLKSGGLFAIETFYQDPEPPFERPFWSYWKEDELTANFLGWEIIESEIKKENTLDLSGKRLRVRDDGKNVWLTYKAHPSTVWEIDSTEEIEISMSSSADAVKILEKIGIPLKRHQEKKRIQYTLGDAIVDLDFWPKIPMVLEIEAPSKERVVQVAKLLGLNWEDAIFVDQQVLHRKYYGIDLNTMKEYKF